MGAGNHQVPTMSLVSIQTDGETRWTLVKNALETDGNNHELAAGLLIQIARKWQTMPQIEHEQYLQRLRMDRYQYMDPRNISRIPTQRKPID
jgi:hypothetical protein